MRIAIDLDGTICEIKKPDETYADVKPKPGAIEKMKEWKKKGHYIIIETARHMKTCDGSVDKVITRIGKITLNWLEKYEIPYDEIHFGKPNVDVYIDDRGLKFDSWKTISLEGYIENNR